MSSKKTTLSSIFVILLVALVGAFTIPSLDFEERIDMTDSQKEALKEMDPFIQKNKERVVFSIDIQGDDSNCEKLAHALSDLISTTLGDSLTNLEYQSDFDPLEFDELVLSQPYLYLEPADYDSIASSLSYSSILQQLELNKEKLSGYSGFGASYRIQLDPLGFSKYAYHHLSSELTKNGRVSENGFYTTPDGSKFILNAQFGYSTDDMKFVHRMTDALEQLKDTWNRTHANHLDFFGVFLIADANATQIRKDITLTVNLALIFILSILLYFYRKLKTIALFVTPGIFGIICALIALKFIQGGISVLALSASAIIMGIVVDYSFHFFSHLQHDDDPYKTRKNIAAPLIISSTTTILAFFSLMLAESKTLRDFGLFTGLSLTFTLLFILTLLPSLIGRNATGKDGGNKAHQQLGKALNKKTLRIHPAIYALFMVATVVMFYFAKDIQFESNIQALNYYPSELKLKEEALTNINPDEDKFVTILSSATDLDDALIANYELGKAIGQIQDSVSSTESRNLGSILIPNSVCDQRTEGWNAFWNTHRDSVLARFERACIQTGFKSSAFPQFEKSINQAEVELYPIELALEFQSFQNLIQRGENWSILSTVTLPTEKYEPIISHIESIPNILVVDGSRVASQTSDAIQSEFNTLFYIAGLIVLIAMLLIYGRIELTLISFLPMIISWIWILGIAHLSGIQFNFINVMIASVIFGLGDDFAIFITDGLLSKYKTGSSVLSSHKIGILLSSVSTLIGTGVLYFGVHPAISSIAPVTVLGISIISLFSFFIQPILFRFFISHRTDKGAPPLQLFEILMSVYAFSLFFVGSIVTTLATALLRLIPFIPRKNKKWVVHKMIQWCCAILINTVFNVKKRYVNKENLDFNNPSILIANHSSFLDILSMAMLHPKIVILVGPWVYNSPIFGWFIRYADYIPAFTSIEEHLDKIQGLVNDGYSIVIFPEGHRSPDGSIKRFHKGAFYLSEQLQIPITPVLLHGYHRTLPKSEYYVKGSTLDMKILPRIQPSDERFPGTYSDKTKSVVKYFRQEHEIFTEEMEGPYYQQHFLLSNYLYKGPILEWYFRIKYKHEKENYEMLHQKIAKDATVYDLGCGYGFSSYYLKQRSERRTVIGIDYDSDKIEVAANGYLMRDGIQFKSEDLTQSQFDHADVFILSDVLHYLKSEQQLDLIQKCADKLNEKGMIIIKDALADKAEEHEWTERSERWSTRWIKFNKTQNELSFFDKKRVEEWAKATNLNVSYLSDSKVSSNTWIQFTRG